MKRICLWSGPRNISTALMYSFAQRSDTRVYDEPLYAHYLSRTEAQSYHPGAKEVLASMENDGEKVVEMMLGPHDRPVAFFKHMTHHLVALDWSFMRHTINVLLTRNPVDMLPSYARAVQNPTMQDVGYESHVALKDFLEAQGLRRPFVLDSRQLQNNPSQKLGELCEYAGIPFDENMLHWQAGPRPEDGVWAPYWYANVHASTRFLPYQPKEEPFPERLKPLLEQCLPLYQDLIA
ncbi:MAG: sulfotransferase family protein [Bacteroidia bacterium]